MTLLEEVIELDTMLANDGYKSWGYARLTLDKVIKALQAPPDVNPHVMQAEGQEKEHPILFSTPMVKAILEGRKSQTRRIVKDLPLDWIEQGFTLDFVASPENNLCPYGKVGDILWVRETHAIEESPNEYRMVIFKATDPDYTGKWKPSIFLKRKDCRIFLRIEAIAIERLQDITEQDSVCEGVEYDKFLDLTARENFCCLWNSINGNWDSNPFVWVISFSRAVGLY